MFRGFEKDKSHEFMVFTAGTSNIRIGSLGLGNWSMLEHSGFARHIKYGFWRSGFGGGSGPHLKA